MDKFSVIVDRYALKKPVNIENSPLLSPPIFSPKNTAHLIIPKSKSFDRNSRRLSVNHSLLSSFSQTEAKPATDLTSKPDLHPTTQDQLTWIESISVINAPESSAFLPSSTPFIPQPTSLSQSQINSSNLLQIPGIPNIRRNTSDMTFSTDGNFNRGQFSSKRLSSFAPRQSKDLPFDSFSKKSLEDLKKNGSLEDKVSSQEHSIEKGLSSFESQNSLDSNIEGEAASKTSIEDSNASDNESIIDEGIMFSQAYRRKSCCCSDCGYLSAFEKKHQNLAYPSKRQEFNRKAEGVSQASLKAVPGTDSFREESFTVQTDLLEENLRYMPVVDFKDLGEEQEETPTVKEEEEKTFSNMALVLEGLSSIKGIPVKQGVHQQRKLTTSFDLNGRRLSKSKTDIVTVQRNFLLKAVNETSKEGSSFSGALPIKKASPVTSAQASPVYGSRREKKMLTMQPFIVKTRMSPKNNLDKLVRSPIRSSLAKNLDVQLSKVLSDLKLKHETNGKKDDESLKRSPNNHKTFSGDLFIHRSLHASPRGNKKFQIPSLIQANSDSEKSSQINPYSPRIMETPSRKHSYHEASNAFSDNPSPRSPFLPVIPGVRPTTLTPVSRVPNSLVKTLPFSGSDRPKSIFGSRNGSIERPIERDVSKKPSLKILETTTFSPKTSGKRRIISLTPKGDATRVVMTEGDSQGLGEPVFSDEKKTTGIKRKIRKNGRTLSLEKTLRATYQSSSSKNTNQMRR